MRAIFLACLVVLGCAGSNQSAIAQAVTLRCQIEALHRLPLNDPDTISVGHAKALAADLKACQPLGDAGSR